MNKNKKLRLEIVIIPVIIALLVIAGIWLTSPVYAFKMDINPSMEIYFNRLNQVVSVKPLNKDAEEMLRNYDLKEKELEKAVRNLVDRIIEKGYISDNKENTVMITVDGKVIEQKVLNILNNAVTTELETKKIDANVVNQEVSDPNTGKVQTGKEIVIEKITAQSPDVPVEALSEMTLTELIMFANERLLVGEQLITIAEISNEDIDKDSDDIDEDADDEEDTDDDADDDEDINDDDDEDINDDDDEDINDDDDDDDEDINDDDDEDINDDENIDDDEDDDADEKENANSANKIDTIEKKQKDVNTSNIIDNEKKNSDSAPEEKNVVNDTEEDGNDTENVDDVDDDNVGENDEDDDD